MIIAGPKITVGEWQLFNSFRYCLGRQTYAVSECVETILEVWPELSSKVQDLMYKETQEAIKKDQAGAAMDRRQWLRVAERWEVDHANA